VCAFQVAGPEIVRLHHVKVAVEDQIAVACHIAPPMGSLADYPQKRRQQKGLFSRVPVVSGRTWARMPDRAESE
jgi:hypothetical protein